MSFSWLTRLPWPREGESGNPAVLITAAQRRVLTIALIFFSLTLLLLCQRYFSFTASYVSFDQGIFNQVFWNGLRGDFFQSSLSSTLSTPVVHDGEVPRVAYHRLGQHFTPALLLWLPLYAIAPGPIVLMILQVTLTTSAGLVLYALARHYLAPNLSVWLTASYYCANAVIGPTVANFHDLCQIPLFMFGLLLALEKQWWWAFGLLSVLTLLVREDTGIALFGVGAYLILSRRYPQLGLAVCSLSFLYVLSLTNVIMPFFSEDISRRFMIERFGQYVEGSEATTVEIVWAIVRRPWRMAIELLTPFGRKVEYLLGQWLPLALVPAIAPAAWIIAGFPLLAIFLQRGQSPLSLNIRYAIVVVPGLWYGAILWWAQVGAGWLGKWPGRPDPDQPAQPETHPLPRRLRQFWITCLVLALGFTIASNPNRALSFIIPDSINPWVYISPVRQWQHAQAIRPFLAEIPPTASVSATTHIVPHLSSRREIVRFPDLRLRNDQGKVIFMDYVIADLWQLQQYQVAFKDDRQKLEAMIPAIDQMLTSQDYGLRAIRDGVLFCQRDAPSDPQALADWTTLRQELLAGLGNPP
ncbi:DUF2079 domain-containing protein [Trichothermofontia sichuanensis B231]|uniref:DUF2079 domain-containing protein n=1 Tax=Trichothermofontia sichuanensis TaxID=3045816 RepID=UPI002247133E|nr:DUF2079 domain-containing protein [Trichothermofontia sichuanensis B231]